MAFSGALTLTDLNDFITPAQACIKPVEEVKAPEDYKEPGAASTEIRVDSSGAYYEVAQDDTQRTRKLQTAQISLNDCLACSGCITSAESVLITLQSHEEVLNFLSSNPPMTSPDHRIPVLSIAPQSLASLSASISTSSQSPISLRQILRRVQAFCKHELGFAHVYDTTFARHISLLEHKQEFRERQRAAKENAEVGALPMLASACPGWVCYAEKTHAEVLPFVSRTKSPQQVMGTLVKKWLGEKWGKKPNDIYHVAVMPCYDKKLEASRQDFYNDVYSTRDVDCVITTGELELMMRERHWNLSIPVPGEEQDADLSSLNAALILPELLVHPGTSSGSYLHALLAEHLTTDTELTTRTIRSADYEEFVVSDKQTGRVTFKGAKCYGFRNLQNVVRKVGRGAGVQIGRGAAGRLATMNTNGNGNMRRGAIGRKVGKSAGADNLKEREYDYVEVMACPSGCVNGGGQLKPPNRKGAGASRATTEDSSNPNSIIPNGSASEAVDLESASALLPNAKWGDREWTRRVEDAYWHDLPTPPASPRAGFELNLELEIARPGSGPSDSGSGSAEGASSPQVTEPGKSGSMGSSSDGDGDGVVSVRQAESRALADADGLAVRVLLDLCRPQTNVNVADWASEMDVGAEEARRRYFRTEYRAVISDVVGLQVKW